MSEERTGRSLDKNPLTSKVKASFRTWILEWWVVATKAWLVAGSWSADSGDEILGTWSPIVDLLRRRWRWGLCMGLVFYSQGRERIKKEREEQREYDVLYPDLKNIYFILWSAFFTIQHTHTKHIFYIFEHWNSYLNHDTKHFFFFFFVLKTHISITLFKPQFSHLFK